MTTRTFGDGEHIRVGTYNEYADFFLDTSASSVIIQSGTSATDNSPQDRITLSHTETVFNEGSVSRDVRMESDANSAMFFMDASGDAIGINTSTPDTDFNIYTNDTSTAAALRVEQDSTGDACMDFLLTGGATYVIGVDNSGSDVLAISRGAVLGTDDMLRITNASPPVLTWNTTHPTGTFDYVCEDCGAHGPDIFECCGAVKWHDDVEALVPVLQSLSGQPMTGLEPGMQHLADMGVLEISTNNDGSPWIGVRQDTSFWYTLSCLVQLWNRVKRLEGAAA
jgi:hypothetical protein